MRNFHSRGLDRHLVQLVRSIILVGRSSLLRPWCVRASVCVCVRACTYVCVQTGEREVGVERSGGDEDSLLETDGLMRTRIDHGDL